MGEPFRQLVRGAIRRTRRIEPVLDAHPHAPQEVGDRLRGRLARIRLGLSAHRTAPESRPTRSPGWMDGPTLSPFDFAAKSRIAPSASKRGVYPISLTSRSLSTPRPKRSMRTPSPYRGPAP